MLASKCDSTVKFIHFHRSGMKYFFHCENLFTPELWIFFTSHLWKSFHITTVNFFHITPMKIFSHYISEFFSYHHYENLFTPEVWIFFHITSVNFFHITSMNFFHITARCDIFGNSLSVKPVFILDSNQCLDLYCY